MYTSSESALHPSNEMANEESSVLCRANETKVIAYQKTKAVADTMVLSAISKTLRVATLRLPTVYGEGNPYMTLSILQQLRKGENEVQAGNNTTLKDSLYVASATSAHILAAECLLAGFSDPNALRVDGEGFLLSGCEVLLSYDFMRKDWPAVGEKSMAEDVKVIPMWVAMSITGATELVYWIITAGTKEPAMKREALVYLDRKILI